MFDWHCPLDYCGAEASAQGRMCLYWQHITVWLFIDLPLHYVCVSASRVASILLCHGEVFEVLDVFILEQ